MAQVLTDIPVWFYAISSGVYLISAIICFLVSYFSFKAYKMSSKKNLLYLFLSFLILGFGFLSLTIPSIYVYTTQEMKIQYPISINQINYMGFNIYYLTSFIAYLFLVITYFSGKVKNKFLVLFVPLWYADSVQFHVISLLLLLLILIQSISNSIKKKRLNSYLVTFSFLCLSIFHLLWIFVSFNVMIYLIANLILIAGFLSFLYMLIRVNRND
jgi:hypothetical protein